MYKSIALNIALLLQLLASLLYNAATDCGFVDVKKVQDVLGLSQEQAALTDQTESDPTQLTRRQIVRLADAITEYNMASIAEGYMDISGANIKMLQYENKGKIFNREVVKYWAKKNSDNQVKVNCFCYYDVMRSLNFHW